MNGDEFHSACISLSADFHMLIGVARFLTKTCFLFCQPQPLDAGQAVEGRDVRMGWKRQKKEKYTTKKTCFIIIVRNQI